MSFFTTSYPVARKAHMCVECRGAIEPGQRYARLAGATDGRGWSERMCLPCHGLAVEAWDLCHADKLLLEDGPVFGELVTWIEEAGWDERLSPEGFARWWAVREKQRLSAGAPRDGG